MTNPPPSYTTSWDTTECDALSDLAARIDLPRRSSHVFCKFNHSCGGVPK